MAQPHRLPAAGSPRPPGGGQRPLRQSRPWLGSLGWSLVSGYRSQRVRPAVQHRLLPALSPRCAAPGSCRRWPSRPGRHRLVLGLLPRCQPDPLQAGSRRVQPSCRLLGSRLPLGRPHELLLSGGLLGVAVPPSLCGLLLVRASAAVAVGRTHGPAGNAHSQQWHPARRASCGLLRRSDRLAVAAPASRPALGPAAAGRPGPLCCLPSRRQGRRLALLARRGSLAQDARPALPGRLAGTRRTGGARR